jgi:ribosomal protein S27AE
MRCKKCGAENTEGFKFCGTCGTPLVGPPEAEAMGTGTSHNSPAEIMEGGRPNFLTLSCPSCGGKLQITNDIERFACGYCGKEHLVRRGGGIVTLSPVVDGLKKIQEGTDKTASELAILRLSNEIAEIEKNINNLIARLELNESEPLIDYFGKYTSYWQKIFTPRNVDLHKEMARLTNKNTEDMISHFRELPEAKRHPGFLISLGRLLALQNSLNGKQSELEKHKRIVGG